MLSPQQLQAIQMRLQGKTIQEICKKLHISAMTLYRWERQKHYQEECERLADAFVNRTQETFLSRMERITASALNVIEMALADGKLDAALKVLDVYCRIMSITNQQGQNTTPVKVLFAPEAEEVVNA